MASSFQTNVLEWSSSENCQLQEFCQLQDGGVVICGRTQGNKRRACGFHVYDKLGSKVNTWPGPNCEHAKDGLSAMLEVPIDSNKYLAVSCPLCATITFHTLPNGTVHSIFNIQDVNPRLMCLGPKNTLLVSDYRAQEVVQLLYSSSNVAITQRIPLAIKCPDDLCYTDQQLFCCKSEDNLVSSTNIVSKQILWTIHAEAYYEPIYPQGLCTDKLGRLYVADSMNCRVVILHSKTGKVIQSIWLQSLTNILNVGWSDTQPHLTVCSHGLELEDDDYEDDEYEFIYEITHFNIDTITKIGVQPLLYPARGDMAAAPAASVSRKDKPAPVASSVAPVQSPKQMPKVPVYKSPLGCDLARASRNLYLQWTYGPT